MVQDDIKLEVTLDIGSLVSTYCCLGRSESRNILPLVTPIGVEPCQYIAPDVGHCTVEEYFQVLDAASIWDSFGASAV